MRFIIFLLLLPGSLFAQALNLADPLVREIISLQDARITPPKRIIELTGNVSSEVRFAAYLALGNIGDTTSVRATANGMRDNEESVRSAAAFALGQMPCVLSREELARTLSTSSIPSHIEAIGKVGDSTFLIQFVKQKKLLSTDAAREAFLLGIARFAIRKIFSQEGATTAATFLVSKNSEERWKAAYALWRMGDSTVLLKHTEKLIASLRDGDNRTRMFAASALGKIHSKKILPALRKAFNSEKNWNVRVNIVRAFGNFSRNDALSDLTHAINDSSLHVVNATVETLLLLIPSFESVPVSEKSAISALAKTLEIRSPACALPLSARAAQDEILPTLVTLVAHSPKMDEALFAASAMGEVLTQRACDSLIALIPRMPLPTTIKLFSALSNIFEKKSLLRTANKEKNIALIINQLSSSVPTRNAYAAELSILDSNWTDDSRIGKALLFCALGLAPRSDVDEVKLSLASAIEKCKRSIDNTGFLSLYERERSYAMKKKLADIAVKRSLDVVMPERVTSVPTIDWKFLSSFPDTMHLQTTKGAVTIRFRKDVAPLTCLNFFKLFSTRQYDTTMFHRVVPNFVAQGGDPEGTGSGGPPYAIRTETGLTHYARGSIGMASSGKDTEGSQYFFTHLPTPHLDGRYTLFAEVLAGMDVVDALQLGDKLVNIY